RQNAHLAQLDGVVDLWPGQFFVAILGLRAAAHADLPCSRVVRFTSCMVVVIVTTRMQDGLSGRRSGRQRFQSARKGRPAVSGVVLTDAVSNEPAVYQRAKSAGYGLFHGLPLDRGFAPR